MKNSLFYRQAELLLRILPYIGAEKDLALKGGTAINFFLRDLPRLSVDIDLCYLPVVGREKTLNNISEAMDRIIAAIKSHYPNSQISPRINHREGIKYGFSIVINNVTIKVETNYVFRGSVYPVIDRDLSTECQSLFNIAMRFQTLSREDLYGSKICAALDRQHPRDLFDIKQLIEGEGLDTKVRKAFIVYLISHPRPLVELLDPKMKDIQNEYLNEFQGMTREDVNLEELLEARLQLTTWIKSSLSKAEREFLLSFKQAQPKWGLLEMDHIQNLPSVKWKLKNIKAMSPEKHAVAVNKLKKWLGV